MEPSSFPGVGLQNVANHFLGDAVSVVYEQWDQGCCREGEKLFAGRSLCPPQKAGAEVQLAGRAGVRRAELIFGVLHSRPHGVNYPIPWGASVKGELAFEHALNPDTPRQGNRQIFRVQTFQSVRATVLLRELF